MLAPLLLAAVMTPAADKEPGGRFVAATGKLRTAAMSADGRRVATASDGGPVLVYDAVSGRQLARIKPASDGMRLAFSHDGKDLLVACDRGLYLFDAATGKALHSVEDKHTTFSDAMFLPGGGAFVYRTLVYSPWSSTRFIPNSYHVKAALRGDGKEQKGKGLFDVQVMDTAGVSSLASSPDGEVIAAGWRNGCVRFYSIEGGKGLAEGKGPMATVQSIAFAPDGRSAASVCNDGVVRLWERRTGGERWGVRGHKGGARVAAFSPDGRVVASAGEDGTIKLWCARSNEEWRAKKGPKGTVMALQFEPKGRLLALSIDHVSARLWVADDGKTRPEVKAVRLDAAAMAKAWAALEGEDPAEAHKAMAALEASPGAVAYLRGKVAPSREAKPAALEALRAVEVLERIGGKEGVAALKAIAGGHEKSGLTAEAREALDRLAERR